RREAEPPRITRVRRLPQTRGGSPAHCLEVGFAGVVGQLHGLCERSFSLVDAEHRVVDAIIRTEQVKNRVRLWIWPNLAKPGARLMYGHGCNPHAMLADERDFALPVTGPLAIEGEMLPGPGLVTWAGGITVHPATLPALDATTATRMAGQDPARSGGEPWWPEFINHHAHWVGKNGVACLTTECETAEAVNLYLGFGYDGPVRLWLDDREIHANPHGTNPCVADHHRIPVRLSPGKHRLTLALDVNGGAAWGFALRWLAPRPCRWPVALTPQEAK
ncbi:MAG: hypothetical protein H7067_11280, partial [Burkholderiales bacterium]|nr:hypothetical protein [Opitutaceae bacterium]